MNIKIQYFRKFETLVFPILLSLVKRSREFLLALNREKDFHFKYMISTSHISLRACDTYLLILCFYMFVSKVHKIFFSKFEKGQRR